jgi:quinol monooxygenase YgiN
MVLEHVDIRILPAKQADFEAVITQGLSMVYSQAKGMHGYHVYRCVESPERYVMQIWWGSIDDHMVSYRQGPLSPAFRALVEPFFAQPPTMNHFQSVVSCGASAGVDVPP